MMPKSRTEPRESPIKLEEARIGAHLRYHGPGQENQPSFQILKDWLNKALNGN